MTAENTLGQLILAKDVFMACERGMSSWVMLIYIAFF